MTAAIVLWNTVYLERAAAALRGHGQLVDDTLLRYLSPLGWEPARVKVVVASFMQPAAVYRLPSSVPRRPSRVQG